jgi:alkanesulfonate monooxygenase SsuD/methylene tetrahydromethanopterin reductase-like flavin-dependent oxidoreductase (luciferase family)
MSGWTGLDFSKYGPDEPILHSRQDAQTSALEAFTIGDPDRVWTVREIAKHAVGSPEEVAEELIAWVEETDVDGFNLAYAVTPETFADFVNLVVPEQVVKFAECLDRKWAGRFQEHLQHTRPVAPHKRISPR